MTNGFNCSANTTTVEIYSLPHALASLGDLQYISTTEKVSYFISRLYISLLGEIGFGKLVVSGFQIVDEFLDEPRGFLGDPIALVVDGIQEVE